MRRDLNDFNWHSSHTIQKVRVIYSGNLKAQSFTPKGGHYADGPFFVSPEISLRQDCEDCTVNDLFKLVTSFSTFDDLTITLGGNRAGFQL